MEEIAFNDWPGQPVDLGSGANSWFPAYGFQTPSALLEREDFIGNPDAQYFLQSTSTPCLYLETIHEETSDDLRSDSDYSRGSPLGWLASDSETDSVICMDVTNDTDCESDREIACPIKRRRQDNFLALPAEDEYQSLSRSSSLLQFETLEKQCQETFNSSPSIYSQFSFDSLERKVAEEQRSSESESSDGGSETTLAPSKSCCNLKTWHSFDSLPLTGNNKSKDKISAENLSEDSGYSDHMCGNKAKMELRRNSLEGVVKVKNRPLDFNNHPANLFGAYDCAVFQQFTGNFGASCQNLSVFDDGTEPADRFIKNWMRGTTNKASRLLNLEKSTECGRRTSKYNNAASASEPNLLQQQDHSTGCLDAEETVSVCSVPKNLDLVGKNVVKDEWICATTSIAAKNWDLADFSAEEMANYKREGSYSEAMRNRVDLSDDEHSMCYKRKPPPPKTTLEQFDHKILKAISESIHSINSSTISDAYLQNLYAPQPTRNVVNTVSTPNLALSHHVDDEIMDILMEDDRRKSVQDIPRNSTSTTSGMSDIEDKTLCEASSSKGVHFSPVVSEVNWCDDQSTTTAERESSYSLSSTPEREAVATLTRALLEPHEPTPPPPRPRSSNFGNSQSSLHHLDEAARFRSQSQPDMHRLKRRGSQLVKKDKDGTLVKAYVDVDGIQYKHTHLDLDNVYGTKPASPSLPSHVVGSGSVGEVKRSNAVAGMDALDSSRRDERHKSRAGKLGGFFSRLASFRFSNRKSEEKAKKKQGNNAGGALQPQQKIATKDDYIFIPLKGPSPGDASTPRPLAAAAVNHHQQLSSPAQQNGHHPQRDQVVRKPPLPRVPPRVVGASVKRDGSAQGRHSTEHEQHRRRRTIDSGESCPRPMEPMGLIETDLDTEVTVITSGPNVKTRSLLNLGAEPRLGLLTAGHDHGKGAPNFPAGRPHKSMEFLLDKQNLKVVEPPENELQKGERVMSEHQLRVERSLQKLTVPDWYKQSQVPREGFLLKKHPNRESRWTGTGSKTTSLSSLGSSNHSPVVLSPTATIQPFVRWSTSKLNSTASSPCASTRSSFNARQPNGSISPSSVRSSFSYRQPYMGWRSQERLSRPRTPAERLANSLFNNQPTQQVQDSPEIQTSIKEVTSAIVHYVSGLRPESARDGSEERSRSNSPRGSQKLCWLESSFVGIRPLDSPQTPAGLSENQTPAPPTNLRLELQTHNGESVHT